MKKPRKDFVPVRSALPANEQVKDFFASDQLPDDADNLENIENPEDPEDSEDSGDLVKPGENRRPEDIENAGRSGRSNGCKEDSNFKSDRMIKSSEGFDKFQEFREYIRQQSVKHEKHEKQLSYDWFTAIGLEAVDALQTSDCLCQTAKDHMEGRITLPEAIHRVERYYEGPGALTGRHDRTYEADLVSLRIVQILSEDTFTFSQAQYIDIHKRLFEGIYPHAGKIRDYNIVKEEWILDGASVHYGNARNLREMLAYDIEAEQDYGFPERSISAMIRHLAVFVSRLWQIHAFGEGNTRTTAVFFIKYLRSLGFDTGNDVFGTNALYFRNAQVRANFHDDTKKIRETTEYLELFLRNLLLGESNVLLNQALHICRESQEADIEETKPVRKGPMTDLEGEKQVREVRDGPETDSGVNQAGFETRHQDTDTDSEEKGWEIQIPESAAKKTRQHIQKLFKTYGFELFFTRDDLMNDLEITASSASSLIKKMLEMDLILQITGKEKRKGKGKEKCLFRKRRI